MLYNWSAAMQRAPSSDANPSRVQGICPKGWHLPSDAEWTQLINYLGDANVVGGKLKATTHWDSPNTGATNESGFTALPGGYRSLNGTFGYFGDYGYWWSSTEGNPSLAWNRSLYYNYGGVYRFLNYKDYGFSVRCVRD